MKGPTFERIGKSLLKYFKPVKSVPPHAPTNSLPTTVPSFVSHIDPKEGTPQNSQEELKKGFKILKFRKKGEPNEVLEESTSVPNSQATELATAEKALPEKTPNDWLGMVTSLLKACRRVTTHVRQKFGFKAYKMAADERAKQSIKAVGSIIDTDTEEYFNRPQKAKGA